MTRYDLLDIRAALDKASCWARKQADLFQIIDAKKKVEALLNEPSLPSNLDEAAREYATICHKRKYYPPCDEAFKAGAEWQKEEFEKNRLAACDSLTKEEYDREMNFTTEFIEKHHRTPTFSDAIEYGMRLQREQMMKEDEQ